MAQLLPWLISAAAITSVILAGWVKHWSGWLVLMCQHIAFAAWTVIGGYPGFLPMNVGMFISSAVSLHLWRRAADRTAAAVERRQQQKEAVLGVIDRYWLSYTEGVEHNPWPNDPDGGEGRLAAAAARVAIAAAEGTVDDVLDYLDVALVASARQRRHHGETVVTVDIDGNTRVIPAHGMHITPLDDEGASNRG
jgi:hypothetical protein